MIDWTFYYDLICDDRSIDGRRVSLLKGEILPPSTRNGMLTNDDHVVLITKQIRMNALLLCYTYRYIESVS